MHDPHPTRHLLTILKQEPPPQLPPIIHSFTPTLQIPKPSIQINFYISFPPPLTFKNPKKPKQLLNHIPTHRL
ncbi:TatD family hydrolase, partial [Bacillus altitudinis]|uniref:TatD family hydrolase n=1 Tax=Bacillus altitudinis TaxID=293387 RepID=UPI003B51EFEE